MQKVILKVDWSCERTKRKAIKIVSENKDVQGFAVDDENKQLTVDGDGDMDPISLVKKLRSKFPKTEIVFMESEASRALEASRAPPEPNNPYHGYPPNAYNDYGDYGYGGYPAYGHPNHHNPYNWMTSAPPYWGYNGYNGRQ